MKAEVISIGTELIIGHTVNTNATYISEKLNSIGISVLYHTSVGDNEARILDCLNLALSRSDLIICTGGLGPTDDDISNDVVAKLVAKPILEDNEQKQILEEKFYRIGTKEIPKINYRQARVIQGAEVISNPIGTAIGMRLVFQNSIIMSFPGVPCEMEAMLESQISFLRDELKNRGLDAVIKSKKVKLFNITESKMAQIILDHYEKQGRENPFTQANPSLAPYASLGEVYLRVTALAKTDVAADQQINEIVEDLHKIFPDNIFAYDDESLEQILAKNLRARNLFISFAESCTGGLASKLMTDIPGASNFTKVSFVTYANESKIKLLGVKSETLKFYGAVSKECAAEMVQGLARISDSEVNVSITGIAGPDGATEEKPIGTIYVGISINLPNRPSFLYSDKLTWKNRPLTREQVRELACKKVFWLVNNFLLSLG